MINIKHDLVGERIQPWASELMNFLVEGWVRRKYRDAKNHIIRGLKSREFSFNKEIDGFLISNVNNWEEEFKQTMWIDCIMDEIMEIVSYDTILNNPDRYKSFVDGIKQGKLVLECLKYTPKKIRLGSMH